MAEITTARGLMDEADLVKSELVFENDVERTTVVEYCVKGCTGQWHRGIVTCGDSTYQTREGDAPGVFCAQHVHRSVTVNLKKGIELSGIAGGLG